MDIQEVCGNDGYDGVCRTPTSVLVSIPDETSEFYRAELTPRSDAPIAIGKGKSGEEATLDLAVKLGQASRVAMGRLARIHDDSRA
jgi:hypothetical protein